jgi:hypothetical protein
MILGAESEGLRARPPDARSGRNRKRGLIRVRSRNAREARHSAAAVLLVAQSGSNGDEFRTAGEFRWHAKGVALHFQR